MRRLSKTEKKRLISVYKTFNENYWKAIPNRNVVIETTNKGSPLPPKLGKTLFKCTKAYDGDAETKQIYEDVCQPTVRSFLEGIHGTIIAHGSSGSGKTHTMDGRHEKQLGVIQMTAMDIFNHIQSAPLHSCSLYISLFEIYNQEINDLLTDKPISSRQHPTTKMLMDLNEELVSNYNDFICLVNQSNERRKSSKTELNTHASRSHFVIKLTLEDKGLQDNRPFTSNLFLVDLAGSDATLRNKAKVDAQRQNEANHINKR